MKHYNKIQIVAVMLAVIMTASGCNANAYDEIYNTTTSTTVTSVDTTPVTSEPVDTSVTTTITEPAETSSVTSAAITTVETTASTTVTTKPAETVPVQNIKPVPVLSNISNRSIINYTYGVKNFKTSKNLVLYDFSDKKDTGVSRDGTINPIRMHYGITASLNGNKISFATYNDYPSVCNVSVKAIEIISDTTISSVIISD